MRKLYPFIKCLHPKQIVNPYTHESLLVPCGACEACALQKSAMNSLKCKLECQCHKFNEFVTLTYDDTYVPKAQVVPLRKTCISDYLPLFLDEDERFVLSNTLDSIGDMYNYALVDVSGRFATDGLLLGAAYMRDIDWFSLRNKVGYGDTINVLRYEDVQLFLKRLREKIYRLYGQKIRYYCVGEYGPEHYRPHWHLILSYDCDFLAQGIRQIIRSCWTYGRVDASKSRGKCASYVAGYVNGTCDLPPLYRNSSTKPKQCHSIRLGEELFEVDTEKVYESRDFGFVKRCDIVGGVPTEFNLWRSFTSRIFSRCKAYSSKSIEERVEAYRLEISVVRAYGEDCSLISVARKMLGYILRYNRGYGLAYTRVIYDDDVNHLFFYFCRSNNINFKTFVGSAVDKERLLRSIYTELLCSRYFIRHIAKSHDYSVCKFKVLVIDDFYKFLEYEQLKNQLQWQFDNLTKDSSFADYKFQYNNIYFDDDELDDNFTYRTMRECALKNYQNANKLKKLNDKYNVRKDNK